MQAPANNKTNNLSLNGLEKLLESKRSASTLSESLEPSPATAHSAELNQQDWTVEECSRALGLSRGAIIRRLEDGILPGYKVRRGGIWAWRVRPVWLDPEPEAEQKALQEQAHVTEQEQDSSPNSAPMEIWEELNPADDTQLQEPQTWSTEIAELKAKLELSQQQFQDALAKLESANVRIGYLQARFEASQEQIKLIGQNPDKKSVSASAWSRFKSWFLGKNQS